VQSFNTPYSSVTRLLKPAEWDRCLEIETIHRDVSGENLSREVAARSGSFE
jgi:hypothetical protein